MKLPFSTLFNILLNHSKKADDSKHTLSDIAQKTGISENQLSLYKRGKQENPTIDTVTKILNYFEITMAYLDSENEVEALKYIQQITSDEEAVLHFRNNQDLQLSDEAMNQVAQLLNWVIKNEQAQKSGKNPPPLPNFTKTDD